MLALVLSLAALGSPPTAQAATEAAHSGTYYGATSTATGGGGAFQDVALSTSPGDLVCGSAWLRTQFPATGASGTFALWLLGGAGNESGSAHYSGLGNLGAWTQAQTCVEATSSHSIVRIQFYPTPGSPTVDMDDVDVHRSLAVNGGFENGSGPWTPYPGSNSNYSDYGPGAGTAHSGSHFAATNTQVGGGGIYEDVALSTTPGELICGSAWLRSEGAAGASGTFALWLLGGAANESASARYSGLSSGGWTQEHTCVEATTAHSQLRIQFYPTPGSPTTELDDVDVHQSLAANGGFENGSGPWTPYPGSNSNYADYGPETGTAHSGSHFAATNTQVGGGGIYEDVALSTTPGELVCGSAWLRTEGSGTGAAGSFALLLLGAGASNDTSDTAYSGLGNAGDWSQVQTCVEATGSHSTLRVQFYPAPGSPTVEIDDVDVHQSVSANGGFEFGSGPWGTYPNTDSSYDAYRTSQVSSPSAPPATPVVTTPVKTTLPRSSQRHTLRVKLYLSWTWRYKTTRLDSVKIGSFPRRTHVTFLCTGRGCPHHAKATAAGPQRVRRLLRGMAGRRYRVGQVLRISLTAAGYRPERAEVVFRYGRRPQARLLSR
jgi:hypothetical protein